MSTLGEKEISVNSKNGRIRKHEGKEEEEIGVVAIQRASSHPTTCFQELHSN